MRTTLVLHEVRKRALMQLQPPVRLELADWIEKNVFLPGDVSATPGRVKLWAYQRGIANAISDPAVERVTVVKSVRVGYSMLLTAAMAAFVANEPSPILMLLPTEADARDFVVSDLEPTFLASPSLRALLSGDTDEGGRNTLLSRRFPGGSLKIVAARAPRNLRRHNARVLGIDEADGMEIGAEGDPIALAEKRTLSFANRKILMGSTPTFEETSRVVRSYGESDKRVFEVPCPECGDAHELQWRDIQWPEGEPDRAHWVCPSCGSVVEERHKAAMVEAGRWRATRPEIKGHAGFRLSALISTLPNARWGALVKEYLAAKDHPDRMQVFTNTVLGQPWREAVDDIDPNTLAARAEPFGLTAIPAEVLFITAGVDVQHDRLEVVFLGHGRDQTFALANAVIWGPVDEDGVWHELDEALRSAWRHSFGGMIRVDAAGIDAGDGTTMDAVMNFTRPRYGRRVVAVKGVSGNRPAIKASESRGSKLWIVGVDGLKTQLSNRIARGSSVRFSADLESRFFDEVTSERLVLRYRSGMPVRAWERIPGRKAECLDAMVYALAARGLVGTNLDAREAELRQAPEPPRIPQVIRSAWMNR